MKKILISNIGATDPIRGDRDGPALHISRVYKPDIIYLLNTVEMQENTDKTKKEIEYIYKDFNKNLEIKILPLEFENPSSYDIMTSFETIHNELEKKHKNQEIYINITSGTPQMMASVCLDVVINNRNFIPIQVITPQKGSNADIPHLKRNDAELGQSFDNYQEYFDNRCKQANIFMFRNSALKIKLKKAIRTYSYQTAYDLIDEIKDSQYNDLKSAIKIADDYSNMKLTNRFYQRLGELGLNYRAISDKKLRQIIQAYNILIIKSSKEQLIDFANRVTPLLFEIAKKITYNSMLRGQYQQMVSKHKGVERINADKIPDWATNLQKSIGNTNSQFLGYKHLVCLFKDCSKIIKVDIHKYKQLRKFEEEIRNLSAHTLEPITKEIIQKKTSYRISAILEDIKEILSVELSVKGEYLCFFKKINNLILEKINML